MHHAAACQSGVVSQPLAPRPQQEPTPGGRTHTVTATGAGHLAALLPPVPALPESPWFERLIPGPKEDIADQLLSDTWLKGTFATMPLTCETWKREADKRIAMAAAGTGDDYTFAPFECLLDNMRQVVVHCLAGRQFEEALKDDEHRAFVAVLDQIDRMKQKGAPYKRTVWLAVLFASVQEVISGRHVIDRLRQDARALWDRERLVDFPFYRRRAPGQLTQQRLTYQQIDLDRVLSCRWGGLNPQGRLDAFEEFLHGGRHIGHQLQAWLDTPGLFLCPSFERLDLADFCRFAHLPIYPLGLLTGCARNADGAELTPLSFLDHDLGHAGALRGWDPGAHQGRLFGSPGGRERFRFLVLDCLPAALGRLERVMTLIVFYLLHETRPGLASTQMEDDHCGRLLHGINELRRAGRWGLPACYQNTTDEQAWLACHWAHALYRQLVQDPGEARPAEDLIAQALAQTLPPAQEQWRFFEARRDAIEAWFRSREETEASCYGGVRYSIACQSEWCFLYFEDGLVPFWEDYDKRCEGPVDYRDLAYLAVLHDPETHQQMMQALT